MNTSGPSVSPGASGDIDASARARDRAVPLAASSADVGEFREVGFVGPARIFDERECRKILRSLRGARPKRDWHKGKAVADPVLYRLATRPEIVDRVAGLLGGAVMLWGAAVIRRKPGQVHAWHTDLETSDPDGRTVSVWIGLENTNVRSSLRVIPGSHAFGVAVQQVGAEHGLGRHDITEADVLRWARDRLSEATVDALDMTDGDAVFFDGRLWHGTDNTNRRGTRVALLFQYAAPDTPIRIPDPDSRYEWPFRFLDEPLPPCVMVRGQDLSGVNRIVAPPEVENAERLAAPRLPRGDPLWPSWIADTRGPEGADADRAWKIQRLYRGATRSMRALSSHVSTLEAGTTPHAPHEHADEEVIILLSGAAEVVRVDGRTGAESRDVLQPGSYVYHAARQRHTIRSLGPEPARYLVFKWLADHEDGEGPVLPSTIVHVHPRDVPPGRPGEIRRLRLLDAQTQYLGRLRSHLSILPPGGGYPPHEDGYDVAVLVLDGSLETLGRTVGPGAAIFYAAGEPHGMRNVGAGDASYLVFEFHGGDYEPRVRPDRSRRGIRWRRRLRRALSVLRLPGGE